MHTENIGGVSVAVGSGALYRVGALAAGAVLGRTAVLVSDDTVGPLYGKIVEDSLAAEGFTVFRATLPTGEAAKTMPSVVALYECFSAAALTRADLVAALGGGAVGDTAGFAAATFLRGTAVLHMPTTLLSQVDSCLGGKTAVNLPQGKNLAGAFWPPVAVAADTDTLNTLPDSALRDGAAEMLKHGLIADAALFARLADGVALRDEALILCNLRIKGALVSEDPRDAGARNLLNFGHTVGHAYEALGGFAGLTHGQAVAAGMVAEAWLGQALGLTPPGTDAQIAAAVRAYGLPERVEYPAGAVCDAALADKKRRGNTLLLPVLREVGRAELVPVPLADFRACLEEIL